VGKPHEETTCAKHSHEARTGYNLTKLLVLTARSSARSNGDSQVVVNTRRNYLHEAQPRSSPRAGYNLTKLLVLTERSSARTNGDSHPSSSTSSRRMTPLHREGNASADCACAQLCSRDLADFAVSPHVRPLAWLLCNLLIVQLCDLGT
jgi:hypothetical protein